MQRNNKQNVLKRSLLAAAMGAVLLTGAATANAAGMGKITVLSGLGQPLRAELDVNASREELASLAARVAPVDAFRQANVEYASVLSTVRFVLDKRSDGRPYFKIQTDRPVNDPFVDFLIELSWSSGRLVREYAFLLDPPELKNDNVVNAVDSPISQAPVATGNQRKPRNGAEIAQPIPSKRVPAEPVNKKPKTISDAAPAATGENTRTVKSGDTLGKIAAESAIEGVTLDQMLVALLNNNKDAFDGGNMNRLRAGKILTIPDADKASATSVGESRKIVIAQSADFNSYRNRLADIAEKQTPVAQQSQQASAGKITPKVEEKSVTGSGQDKLQVSRSEVDAKTGKGKASEEDIVARDKALKEANSRIADLEKNLTDLKKLAELKSQSVVDAQKAAQGSKVDNSVATAPATVQTPADKGVSVPAAVPAVSAVAAAEAPALSATAAVVPAEEMPKKKKFVPPPPEPEPSFLEENGLLVYGGAGLLAALLAFLGFRTWKRKRDERGENITVSDLAANSVFGAATTSQSVNSSSAPQTDFGHSIIDEVDTSKEGVDPIQEAELYMAYGRDGEAEKILIDATSKDPGNEAAQLKLLEIYAGRKSVPQFNAVAAELHQRTGGAGPHWEKAAALGRSIDPTNPLYGGGVVAETSIAEAAAATIVTSVTNVSSFEVTRESTIVMQAPPVQEAPPAANDISAAAEMPSAMDFDLDIGGSSPKANTTAEASSPTDMDFDFDLGSSEPTAEGQASSGDLDIDFDAPAANADASNSLDFDIDTPAAESTTTSGASTDNALDFDFDLGDSSSIDVSEPAPQPLDLSAINLDLDTPAVASVDSSEVATKLELAQAYEEMGDREGARELLQEVLTEGSATQQEVARKQTRTARLSASDVKER